MVGTPRLHRVEEILKDAEANGSTQWQSVLRIHRYCGVSLLRAQRLSHRWTLQQTAKLIQDVLTADNHGDARKISHQRISQWENGRDRPSAIYLEALCQIYSSRPDRLGFGTDYSAQVEEFAAAQLAPVTASTLALERAKKSNAETSQSSRINSYGGSLEAAGEEDDVLTRRTLLRAATGAAAGAIALPNDLLESLSGIRRGTLELLETQSVSNTMVDRWEEVAYEYGALQLSLPTPTFLPYILEDFRQVRRMLTQRQPLDLQRRLYRVMSQMAGLIALSINALGDSRETRYWFHISQLAADETGDRNLRAWVQAYEAMSYLWYDRPVRKSVELARTAQAIAGTGNTPALALGAAIEARALAQQGLARESVLAISAAERHFERLTGDALERNSLCFYEQLFRFYQGNALTTAGDISGAMQAQDQALVLTNVDSELDAGLIHLDRAMTLIHAKEFDAGCEKVILALGSLPPSERKGTPLYRARQVLSHVPSNAANRGAPRELLEYVKNVH